MVATSAEAATETTNKAEYKLKNAVRGHVRGARIWFQRLRVLPFRLRGLQVLGDVRIFGGLKLWRLRGSEIVLAKGTTLNASAKRNTLESRGPNILKTIRKGARIEVGEDSGMTSATISAAVSVKVGRRVLIGAGVMITDNDHHVVEPPKGQSRRYLGLAESRPDHGVVIGDDVFLGARSIVLKGVSIGEGSVIAAGSVVTRNIPAFVLAGGNPCRVIRNLEV